MAVSSLKRNDNGTVDSKSVGLNLTEVRIRNRIVINVGVIGFYVDGYKGRQFAPYHPNIFK